MRILEALSALPLSIAALGLLWTGVVPLFYLRFAGLLGLIFILAQLVWIGPHWQVAPIYLAELLVLAASFTAARPSPLVVRLAGVALVLLIAAAVAFSYVLPMFQLPRPTGKYAIGTKILHMTDPSRRETHRQPPGAAREVIVQVWYPAAPSHAPIARYRRWPETTLVSSYMAVLKTSARRDPPVAETGGPFPVILFNPAWKGQRTQNTAQIEDLASHGFVVAAIDHPYNSQIIAFPDGRRMDAQDAPDIPELGIPVEKQIADDDAESNLQADDTLFVLNQLEKSNTTPGNVFYQKLDTSRAGAFGHSFGGAVSMEAARRDRRIRGAINLDGWVFGQVSYTGFPKPYLLITDDSPDPTPADLNTSDGMRRLYVELTLRDMANAKRSAEAYGSSIVMIHGCNHVNFSDRVFYSPLHRLTYGGTIAPARGEAIVEAYTLAFFSKLLKGEDQPLLSGQSSPFPEAKYLVTAPKISAPTMDVSR